MVRPHSRRRRPDRGFGGSERQRAAAARGYPSRRGLDGRDGERARRRPPPSDGPCGGWVVVLVVCAQAGVCLLTRTCVCVVVVGATTPLSESSRFVFVWSLGLFGWRRAAHLVKLEALERVLVRTLDEKRLVPLEIAHLRHTVSYGVIRCHTVLSHLRSRTCDTTRSRPTRIVATHATAPPCSVASAPRDTPAPPPPRRRRSVPLVPPAVARTLSRAPRGGSLCVASRAPQGCARVRRREAPRRRRAARAFAPQTTTRGGGWWVVGGCARPPSRTAPQTQSSVATAATAAHRRRPPRGQQQAAPPRQVSKVW